MLTQCDKAHT